MAKLRLDSVRRPQMAFVKSVEALERKPCAVASPLAKPILRNAPFNVFSLIGRWGEDGDANTNTPFSGMSRRLVRISMAGLGRDFLCSRRI